MYLRRFGESVGDVVMANGWRVYNGFALQKCWFHLMRDADDFRGFIGNKLSSEIHLKFKLRDLLDKDPPMEEREPIKTRLDREMEELVKKHEGCREIEQPMT